MKKETIPSLKKKVWPVFSEYIKKRDCLKATGSLEYGECFTCDYSGHISTLQAGHFIPGRHSANLFSEKGVNAQCRRCNIFLGGNPLEYRRQLIKLYGEGVPEELEEEARQTRKFTVEELKELEQEYREKIRRLGNE